MRNLLLCFLILTSCGQHKKSDNRSVSDQDFNQLKAQVLELSGTIAQLSIFTESDFTDCKAALPPFEQKVCQIAQTATAEQRAEFAGQISEMVKLFQSQLYGTDCVNEIDVGCPVAGTIYAQLASHQQNIAALQVSVGTLQTDLNNLSQRLNNFNGSGQSIEQVITSLTNNINSLSSRVSALETTVSGNISFSYVQLCKDIPSSGPVFETVLVNGNKTTVVSYIKSGSKAGLGVVKAFGDGQGTLYLSTQLNTSTCKFKIYETVNNNLKICWNNQNKSATSISIDSVCNIAVPTSACTCK